MPISRSPRHWISLALAVVWCVLAITQFLDFSGEPPPRWREIALTILAPLCLGLLIYDQQRVHRGPPPAA